MKRLTRRRLLTNSIALAGGSILTGSAAATTTPVAAEGPFYPVSSMRMVDVDNDLVKVAGVVSEAGGEILYLSGRVVGQNGQPLIGGRIEIWQCDVNGKYLHPGDDRSISYDGAFQGFGFDITDNDGNYRFRTIKPTRYPGRTPHIHVKVLDGNRELLTTQFYIDGHPDNDNDFLYRRMSTDQAKRVSMALVENEDGFQARVDVII